MTNSRDKFHLKVALPTLFVMAAVALSSVQELPYCWTPAAFTDSQVDYARNTCNNNLSKQLNGKGMIPQIFIHLVAEAAISISIYILCSQAACLINSRLPNMEPKQSCIKNDPKHVAPPGGRGLKSHAVGLSYFIIQLLGISLWVLAYIFIEMNALVPSAKYSVTLDNTTVATKDIFLCDFEIRQMSNIYMYTVQCEPPSYNPQSLISFVNKVFCLFMAAASTVHFANVFVTGPLKIKKDIKAQMEESFGRMDVQLSYLGFSDVYMNTVLNDDSEEKRLKAE